MVYKTDMSDAEDGLNGYIKTYFYVLFERVVYDKWENKKTDSENK